MSKRPATTMSRVPGSPARLPSGGWRLVRAAAAAAACVLAVGALAGPKPETDLEQAFYDIGVVGYCGLHSGPVAAGFRREVERITERDSIDEAGLQAARSRALTLVELEWANRGLGGFRGWCRTEGEAAVKRFSDSAPAGAPE